MKTAREYIEAGGCPFCDSTETECIDGPRFERSSMKHISVKWKSYLAMEPEKATQGTVDHDFQTRSAAEAYIYSLVGRCPISDVDVVRSTAFGTTQEYWVEEWEV